MIPLPTAFTHLRLAGIAFLCCLGSIASAQDRELVARIPQSAAFIIVVHDAASVLREVSRLPIAPFLGAAAPFAQTQAAWKSLSERLDWPQDQTAERLIGGTSILILADPPDQRSWVLLTTISGETERRLRDRLELAPADIVQGQPLLALKDAELLMAVRRDETLTPGRARLLLLGPNPRDGKGLFHELLPVLSGDAPSPLRTSALLPHIRDVADGPIAVYARLGDGLKAPWSAFFALGLRLAEQRIDADIVLQDQHADALAAIPHTADHALAQLAEGSSLAIFATLPAGALADFAIPWLPAPQAQGPAVASIDRWALALRPLDPARTHHAALLALTRGRNHAPPSDALASRLLAALEGRSDDPAAQAVAVGLDDSILRRTPLADPPVAWLARLLGAPGELSWRTSASADALWWSAALAPLERSTPALHAVESMTAVLAPVPSSPLQPSHRWLLWGRFDPSILVLAAPGPWPVGSPTRTTLDRCKLLSFGFYAEDSGLVRGSISLDLAPPPPARPQEQQPQRPARQRVAPGQSQR